MIFSIITGLGTHPVFKDVPTEYIIKYFNEHSVSLRRFSANEIAYSSKNSTCEVAFLLNGSARVFTGTGHEKTLMRTLRTGDVFGIANLYDEDEPFPSYIVTSSDTEILFINGNAFRKFIENNDIALRNYLRLLSSKVVFLNKKLATLTAGSAEKKLASYILEHRIENEISLPCSLSELANILNMGRASLYRAIDTLCDIGAIQKKGKRILITDIQKIQNL